SLTRGGSPVAGAAQFIGRPDQSQLSTINWSQAAVQFGGAAAVGETWRLTVAGKAYDVVVDATNSVPSLIAQALAAKIAKDGYTVDLRIGLLGDSKLIVRKSSGTFTATFTILPATGATTTNGTGTISGTTADVAGHTWTMAAIQLLTPGQAGDVWSLT